MFLLHQLNHQHQFEVKGKNISRDILVFEFGFCFHLLKLFFEKILKKLFNFKIKSQFKLYHYDKNIDRLLIKVHNRFFYYILLDTNEFYLGK